MRSLGLFAKKWLFKIQDFPPDTPGAGWGLGLAESPVGGVGVERHAALALPLAARDLGAVEAAAHHHLDAERPGLERALHGAAHGAAVGDALLELHRDRLGHQRRVELGLL